MFAPYTLGIDIDIPRPVKFALTDESSLDIECAIIINHLKTTCRFRNSIMF